jgi:hypothetical protein
MAYQGRLRALETLSSFAMPEYIAIQTVLCALPREYQTIKEKVYQLDVSELPSLADLIDQIGALYSGVVNRRPQQPTLIRHPRPAPKIALAYNQSTHREHSSHASSKATSTPPGTKPPPGPGEKRGGGGRGGVAVRGRGGGRGAAKAQLRANGRQHHVGSKP